jgi:hypothetical protein
VRFLVPASALAQAGYRLRLTRTPEPADPGLFDVFVVAHPQMSPALLEAVQRCAQAGKRVIVDLDEDFHHLSVDHPYYAEFGPGNPAALRALEAALALAEVVTVSSPVLAERYQAWAKRVVVMPTGWLRANALWDKPAPRRNTFNVGWIGGPAELADLQMIKTELIQFVRQTPEALLVLGGSPAAYDAFAALPEQRRLYLPLVAFDDYPFMVAHCDVLLAPWRDHPANQAQSDFKLLQAGVRRIPWVATRLPAYNEWGAGGLWADQPGEWLAALKRLAGDALQRQALGEAGRQKAELRESAHLGKLWQKIIHGRNI